MLMIARLLFGVLFAFFGFSTLVAEDPVRMIRSQSGPSGTVVGSKFILDEMRNRFIYPEDKSLTVYFECIAPKGSHVLTAYWKDPQGRVVVISTDLKMEISANELNSYWIFILDATKPSGIWTVELRVNGQPVGSHSFEVVVPEPPKAPTVAEPPAPPSLNELYQKLSKSLVWIHKLNRAGRRIGKSTGFVVAPDAILTAFQSINSSVKIEAEFANGAISAANEIIALNQPQDWILLKANSQDVPAIEIGNPDSIVIGEQMIVFSVAAGSSRTIGAVDITGRGNVPGFGDRIHMNPALPPSAIGGPLLDLHGKAVGVLGGNVLREEPLYRLNLAAPQGRVENNSIDAVPIDKSALQVNHSTFTLQSLLESGVLTPPVESTPVFAFGTTTDNIPANLSITPKSNFSRKETVIVYTNWRQREKIKTGAVSMKLYDAKNRVRTEAPPQKVKLPSDNLMQSVLRFSAADLEAGTYRIDILWDGNPVWRTYIAIKD
jgi:S1-C subfamily serine protease